MIRRHSSRAPLIPVLAIFLALSPAGCGTKSGQRMNPIDAAVVPDADFIVRCDVKSLRETPIGKKIEQMKSDNKKSTPVPAISAEQQAQIEKATGIKGDDINVVLASANLSGIDFKGKPGPSVMNNLPAILAIGFAKPLSFDQLRAGAKTLGEKRADAVVELTLDGTKAVVIKSSKPDEPTVYAATSMDGGTLYVALNETSLKDALVRHHQDKPAAPSTAMAAAEGRLPAGAQFKTTVIVPETVRRAIREQIAANTQKAGPAAGMFMGVVKPFEDLRAVSVNARVATEADFTLSVEFANAQQAAQMALVVPLLQGFIPQGQGEGVPDLSQALSVTNDGPVVSLNLHLAEKDFVPPSTGGNTADSNASPTPTDETGVTETSAAEPVSPTVVEIVPAPAAVPPARPTQPVAPTVVDTTPAPAAAAQPPSTPASVTAVADVPLSPKDDPAWRAAEKKLKSSGAVKDKAGNWTAYVNNSFVEVGDVVSVRHERMIYRWKVRAISRDGVTFDPLDSQAQPQK